MGVMKVGKDSTLGEQTCKRTETEKEPLGRQEANQQRRCPESHGRCFLKEVRSAVSNAAEKSSKMRAEKRLFNAENRVWVQLQGSAGGGKRGRRIITCKWLVSVIFGTSMFLWVE